MVRVKNDRVKPNLGGSGLIPGEISSSSSLLYLRDNPNDLYGRGNTEVPASVSDFFTSWINTLNGDAKTALDELNEEEIKPSPPIIDWMEESEDELPF